MPRQMFAGARAAIYITEQHRHANICKKGQGALFVLSQSGHRRKQMGLNILGIASSEMRNYCCVGETGSAGSVEVQPFLSINKTLRFASLEFKLALSALRQRKHF